MTQAEIERALLAALRASIGNAAAMAALARVELALAALANGRPRSDLPVLIDEWGQALIGRHHAEVDHLKRQLRAIAE
jgi:uncharacterized membrane protein YidH (DUF202 family)